MTNMLLALLVAALPTAIAGPSIGATIDGRDRNTIIQQHRWNDLDELNRIESRERFRNQQQQYRQQDREMIQRQMQRPRVRQIRPDGCPEQVFGSKSFRSCR
ncbi:MAG TPA: hypothetical protein VNS34_09625 [Rhizobiaceae bacterium]|nr:hypothetical protein [Rhizobiaceae bacterium]